MSELENVIERLRNITTVDEIDDADIEAVILEAERLKNELQEAAELLKGWRYGLPGAVQRLQRTIDFLERYERSK